jgi:DNA polymerase-3 subunit gamma/tau
LLDQAIAYGAGSVNEAEVRAMLGAIDQDYLFNLLEALVAGDGSALLKQAEVMEERSLSFEAALQDLAGLLHQIALAQTMPEVIASDLPERDRLLSLAQKISAEDIQLYYQIATLGRRDLSLAPDEFAGFNMSLLRMLAFAPNNTAAPNDTVRTTTPVNTPKTAPAAVSNSATVPAPTVSSTFNGDWRSFSDSLKPGFCKNLAQNCALIAHDESSISLQVPQIHKHLLQYQEVLKTALKERFGQSLKVNLEAAMADDAIATPAAQISEEKATRQASAEESLQQDPFVQGMKEIFNATVIPSSIKPIQ